MKNMKRSKLYFVLAIALGFIPAILGGVFSYKEHQIKQEEIAAFDREFEEYIAALEQRVDQEQALTQERVEQERYHAMRLPPDDQVGSSPNEQVIIPEDTPAPAAPVFPEPPFTTNAPKAGESIGWSISNIIAALGLGNGVIFTVLAFIWRNRENLELLQEVLTGENDLVLLSVGERLKMMVLSLFNKEVKTRYRLRKNRGWSIYGAPSTWLDITSDNRKLFLINRLQEPWRTFLDHLDGVNNTDRICERLMFMLGDNTVSHGELGAWKISPAYDSFQDAFDDLLPDEALIFIVVRDENNHLKHHALTTEMDRVPTDLRGWELFIDAFRNKFYFEDDKSILEYVLCATEK